VDYINRMTGERLAHLLASRRFIEMGQNCSLRFIAIQMHWMRPSRSSMICYEVGGFFVDLPSFLLLLNGTPFVKIAVFIHNIYSTTEAGLIER
jgi:hypothetical protein